MITSTSNPRVKAWARLRDRSERDATGLFPIEGHRAVQRAFEARWPLDTVLLAPDLAPAATIGLADDITSAGTPCVELGRDAFGRVAYRRHPDGIIAIGLTAATDLDRLRAGDDSLILVIEGAEKPGNIGAMVRTADGAGVDAVIAADPATDLFNPNVVRASQGALFTMATAVAPADEVAAWLTGSSVAAVAASPHAGAAPWETPLTGAVAVVIGSEHAGVSPVWNEATPVRIPMAGSSDSLNAATAAAVLLYEAVRQRAS
jgi:TrmH family RNA methyltransferase